MGSTGTSSEAELLEELGRARERVAALERRLGLSVASEAGHSNRDMLQALVANIPDYVYFKDRERRFVLASKPFCDLFQRSLSEILGKTDEDLFPPEIAAGTVADDLRVLAGETVVGREEGDEQLGWVLSTKVPWRDAAGEVIGLLGVSRDISKLKRVERALLESLEFSEQVHSASPIGMATYRACGQCVSVNRSLPEILGASAEQLLAQRFPEIESWQKSGLRSAAAATLATGEPSQKQVRLETSFGTEVWLDCRLARFSADGAPHLLLLVDDVTEGRQLEAKILQAQKLESLGVLAGGIAHDFNNLLVGVLLNADLLLRRLPADSPMAAGLGSIQEAARQLAGLTNQLLAYAGKARFAAREVELGEVVAEMRTLLEHSISKKTTIVCELDPTCPRLVADPTQVRQVVLNLVINASEAMGDQEGTVRIRTASRRLSAPELREVSIGGAMQEGEFVVLSVSDDGAGMDAETRARVFDPFFTTKFTGRGLGLAAVLGILRSHQGGARVESAVGKGATFSTFFPVESQLKAEAGARREESSWRGGGLVLLVDDESSVLLAGREALEYLGFEVVVASDGRQAIDIFTELGEEITCVLLDLMMPHKDGEETFSELSRLDPKVRVILSSGYSELDAAGRFEGRGIAGFIQKPYELETLRTKLRAVLG